MAVSTTRIKAGAREGAARQQQGKGGPCPCPPKTGGAWKLDELELHEDHVCGAEGKGEEISAQIPWDSSAASPLIPDLSPVSSSCELTLFPLTNDVHLASR